MPFPSVRMPGCPGVVVVACGIECDVLRVDVVLADDGATRVGAIVGATDAEAACPAPTGKAGNWW